MRTFFASRHVLLLVLLLTFVLAPAPATLATNGSPEGAQEEATGEPPAPPTEIPTEVPTELPTEIPTEAPTEPPTAIPTEPRTEVPTEPTVEATQEVTATPPVEVTAEPTLPPELTAEATLETLLAPAPLVARVEPVTEASLMAVQTFVVNSTLDDPDAAPNGICATAGGVCTLRAAIQESNAPPIDKDTINFNIPGPGPHVISPTMALPSITSPVIINGMSEPGYTWGTPQIVLDGSGAGGVSGFALFPSAPGSVIKGLVINDWDFAFEIYGDNSLIQANFIGTNPAGAVAEGNTFGGIILWAGADNNTIGGTTAALRNLISGNDGYGVLLNTGVTGNRIQGNYIGTNKTGTLDLGNAWSGVRIEGASGNTTGGTVAGSRNVISGNNIFGVQISGVTASDNLIQGNYIGTNAAGTMPLGNSSTGVEFTDAPNNVVGGTVAGARNVISSNGAYGIYFCCAGATGNRVQGNYIGTNAAGTADLGNAWDGVFIAAPNNIIGDTVAGARNVISGNNTGGVAIIGSAAVPANGNLVMGNFIGTNAAGTGDLGNNFAGVYISIGRNNVVGGSMAGAANRIAFNDITGVSINDDLAMPNPDRNRVLNNLIYGNGALGIDLGEDGPTPNDLDDPDAGPNFGQNFPVLADMRGNRFTGRLNTVPSGAYRLQFYASPPTFGCNASGDGAEGQRYLGTAVVMTDSGGDASFNLTFPNLTVTAGWHVTATATDIVGNTSEFSKCVIANLGIPVLTSPANGAITSDTTPTFTWNAVPNATGYWFQIAYDPGFAALPLSATLGGNSLTLPPGTPLTPGETYYWRVAAFGPGTSEKQVTPWSATRRLNIGP